MVTDTVDCTYELVSYWYWFGSETSQVINIGRIWLLVVRTLRPGHGKGPKCSSNLLQPFSVRTWSLGPSILWWAVQCDEYNKKLNPVERVPFELVYHCRLLGDFCQFPPLIRSLLA